VEPVTASVDVRGLVQAAVTREDQRFEEGSDDSEGLGVSLRPTSPLTQRDDQTDDEPEAPGYHPSHAAQSINHIEKKRRNAAAHKRRAKKRASTAASGHMPHTYAAKPSAVRHHAEDLPALQIPVDGESFPAASSGSWVGKRSKGSKKEPWTIPELLQEDFLIVEWDGR